MKTKKYSNFKIFSVCFILIIYLISTFFISFNFFSKEFNKNDLERNNQNKSFSLDKDALPYDFFGQYNHEGVYLVSYIPEGGSANWVEKILYGIDEVKEFYESDEWQNASLHNQIFLLSEEVTNGIGIKSFQNYTSMFHNSINEGYVPYYYNQGKYDLSEDPELDGFIGINPNWTLLSFSYYMEDWIVWNWNERLDKDWYDPTLVAINNETSNDNTSFKFYAPKISDIFINNSYLLENNLKNETIGNNLLRGVRFYMWNYVTYEQTTNISIFMDEKPKYTWEYNPYKTSYYFSAPRLENRIVLSNKDETINDKFDSNIVHNEFRNNFYLETEFNEFKNEFEDYLIKGLNYEFIKEYGIEELGHDRNQGIYLIEDIRKNDLEINYYKLIDDDLFLINNLEGEKELKDFDEIIVEIKTSNDSLIVEENETISIKFEPKKELNSNIAPPYNWDNKNSFLIIFLFLLVLLFIVFFIVFFSKKEKASKENENIN